MNKTGMISTCPLSIAFLNRITRYVKFSKKISDFKEKVINSAKKYVRLFCILLAMMFLKIFVLFSLLTRFLADFHVYCSYGKLGISSDSFVFLSVSDHFYLI